MRCEWPQGASPGRLLLGPPGREACFELRAELVALHGPRPRGQAERALLLLPDAQLEVLRAGDVAPGEARRRGPVYSQAPAGVLAVPTGRVFLVLAEPALEPGFAQELARRGLRPLAPGAPAPGTLWIEPESGRIEDGLAALDALKAMPGVRNAEPELVREAQRR